MSLQEPFEYDLGDMLWRLYSSAKYELTTYGRSVAENILIWILCYYLICGVLYTLIFYKKNWSCSKIKGAKRALFVTAHPDDECMFFGPTIVHFVQQGIDVHLMCITEGDHDGKGRERQDELWRACLALGIPAERVTLLRDSQLQDDPSARWPTEHLAQLLLQHVEALTVDTLVTFDKAGVSGHANHKAIFLAVAYLCMERRLPDYCSLLTLDSVNILRKYWGYLDIPISFIFASNRFIQPLNGLAPSYLTDLCVKDNLNQRQLTLGSAKSDTSDRLFEPSRTNTAKFGDRAFSVLGPISWNGLPFGLRFVLSLKERRRVICSMKEHKSQMVWFRFLYLFFSRFIVINTLKEVTILDLELELDLDD